jgi:hypothetical protein
VVAWDRGLVEDSSAAQYGQCRPTVCRTPDEHVINTAKRPIPVGGERIICFEGNEAFGRPGRLPRTAVAHAQVIDDMPTGPEPDAVSGFVGIHVPGDDYMTWFLGSQCVERPCHRHGLQATFPFMINLIVRQMVGQPNPPIRVRSQDLGYKTRTGELMGALGVTCRSTSTTRPNGHLVAVVMPEPFASRWLACAN